MLWPCRIIIITILPLVVHIVISALIEGIVLNPIKIFLER